MPRHSASIQEPIWAGVAPRSLAAWNTSAAELVKPTRTATKPALKDDTERSLKKRMAAHHFFFTAVEVTAGRRSVHRTLIIKAGHGNAGCPGGDNPRPPAAAQPSAGPVMLGLSASHAAGQVTVPVIMLRSMRLVMADRRKSVLVETQG